MRMELLAKRLRRCARHLNSKRISPDGFRELVNELESKRW